MSKWDDRLAAIRGAGSCAVSADSAEKGADRPEMPPKGANGTNGTMPPLPASIAAGLDRLTAMPAPRIKQPAVWPEIVADALRLASGGWAQQAMALGWEPLQLFGCSPAAGGLADLEGLAVWLAGRRIVILDEASCVALNGPRSHAVFTRRRMSGAVFLWEMGRRG